MRAEHDVSVRDAQQQSAEADAVEPGHPLRGWMAAQREVMARLDAFLASPAIPTDAVDALDRRIATDEVERLRAVLAEQAAVAAARGARAAGGRRISVRDFGAAGDGRRDDGPPLRAAVAALAAAGPGTTLHIPAGMYRLSGFADPRRRYALVLRDLAHVTIDADPGTTLVSSEVGGVLLAVGCRDVHVRNLALDHDPLPTTQGVVEAAEVVPGDARAVTAGDMTGTGADADNLLALTWRLDDGHTPPDAPPISLVNAANGNAYDATTGEPLGGHGGFALRRVERLDARRFRLVGAVGGRAADELRAGHVPSLYAPGTRLGLRTRGIDGGRCALWVDDCTFCDFEGVEIRASYHFAALVSHTTACSFRRCRIGAALATGGAAHRLCAANADGFHCKSNRHGPLIEACEVLNVPDDCGNLYARCASAADRLDDRTLLLDAVWDDEDRYAGDFADGRPSADRWGWRPDRRAFRAGDLLLVIDPTSGSPDLVARVVAARPHEWHGRRALAVELDAPLPPQLRTRRSIGYDRPLHSDSHFLRHLHDDPQAPIEHFVVNLSAKSDGFAVRDCHMGRNTVTAFKVKASNGVFEGNHFERHGWCCLSLGMELMWQEGFAPRGLLVRGNRFENRFGVTTFCSYPGDDVRGPAYVRRLAVEGNTFAHGGDGWSLRLHDCHDLNVADNVMPTDEPIRVRSDVSGLRLANNHRP